MASKFSKSVYIMSLFGVAPVEGVAGVTKLWGLGMVPLRGILPTTVLCAGFLLFKGGFINDSAEPEFLRLDNCNVGPGLFDFLRGSPKDCLSQCSTSFSLDSLWGSSSSTVLMRRFSKFLFLS